MFWVEWKWKTTKTNLCYAAELLSRYQMPRLDDLMTFISIDAKKKKIF